MKLHEQRDTLRAQLNAAVQGLDDLRDYLLLPKFHDDTTVQAGDVLRRVAEIKVATMDAENGDS